MLPQARPDKLSSNPPSDHAFIATLWIAGGTSPKSSESFS